MLLMPNCSVTWWKRIFRLLLKKDICFLQYTSGSTGWPKGVIVTHKNIMANEVMIAEAFGTQPEDVGLTWLPVYHDMGLIGSVLQTVYVGLTCYVMSPLDFIRKPLKWLQFISEKASRLVVDQTLPMNCAYIASLMSRLQRLI